MNDVVPPRSRVCTASRRGRATSDADSRQRLPGSTQSCDAQAFHTFGTTVALVRYLATLLKPDGAMCIAHGCFSEECAAIPEPFRDTGGWQADYTRYHSAPWWRAHVEASGVFDVEACAEFEDGDVMWEDDVLYRGDRADWSADYVSRAGWLIRHIQYGQTHRPRLTHLLLKAIRRSRRSSESITPSTPQGPQP